MTSFQFTVVYVMSFGIGTFFFSVLFLLPTFRR